jgi:hypothetical protein
MRLTNRVVGLFAGLALFCASCVAVGGKDAKPVKTASEASSVSCRVQVMVLAFDREVIEPLLKDSKLSSSVLLGFWKEGKGHLLAVQSTLASSSNGGKMKATNLEYLYKGVRYSGCGPNGAMSETPDFEQRGLGMTLCADIVDGAAAKAPVITVDAAAEFVFKPTGDAASGPGGMEKYPRIGTVTAKTTSRMPFGEQILLGGGAESPDKKEFLFVLGQADPTDELEKSGTTTTCFGQPNTNMNDKER